MNPVWSVLVSFLLCGLDTPRLRLEHASDDLPCLSAAPILSGELARFELAVEEVLEDAAAEGEQGARITVGLTYAPVPALDSEWARATLAALRLE